MKPKEDVSTDSLSRDSKWTAIRSSSITTSSTVSDMKPGEEHTSTDSLSRDSIWKRHADLYMEDGSVVLLAENTLFRVYMKWLAKKSEVFAQLSSFDHLQPPDSETYDGCPLIRLTDTAQDLEHFLVSMDGCGQYFALNKPTPFPAVAGVLRMASKYMVTSLQEKAIEHLCRIYPTRFEDMQSDHKSIRNEVFGSASDAPEHPIILVNLVRSCQIGKLLPWAYYAVVRWSFRDMVAGHTMADGTVVRLSSEDMQICLLGFEALLAIQHTNIKQTFTGPASKCTSWSSCSEAINDAYTRSLDEHGTGLVAPLGPLRRKVNACDRCVAHIKKLDLEKRKEVWQQLPSVFGLSSWTEILSSKL